MKADLYTKAVLTIIALALAVMTVRLLISPSGTASAQDSTPADTHNADMKALRDYQEEWYRIYAANDIEKLTAGFDEDGMLVSRKGVAVRGKDPAIWKRSIAGPPITLKGEISRIEVSKSGDIAYIWGSYTAAMKDRTAGTPITKTGTYVTIYRKRAGNAWKIALDINASN